MPKVGYRFRPTEQELLEYYLYNKITQNPVLYEDDDRPVIDWDLYGFDEPWDIWNICGGNNLLDDKSLYFFTHLKRLSASRFNRRIASGAWQGEDGAKPVFAPGSSHQILGFRKRFRYENKSNPKEHGRWIMNEFTLNSSLLGQHSLKPLDLVLCRIKKKESEQDNGKANLGKKPKKRKLKEAASPNSNTDQGDECFQNKRHEAVLVQQFHSPCSCITQQTVESDVEIVESLPEDFGTFDVEKYSSCLEQILQHDCTEEHGDEGAQNNQLRGGDEETILVQQNQSTELPCCNSIMQIMESEGEMESLPDSLTFRVEDFLSNLDEIPKVDCTEGHDEECVQSGVEEGGTLQAVEYEGVKGWLPEEYVTKVDEIVKRVFTSTALESLEEWAF